MAGPPAWGRCQVDCCPRALGSWIPKALAHPTAGSRVRVWVNRASASVCRLLRSELRLRLQQQQQPKRGGGQFAPAHIMQWCHSKGQHSSAGGAWLATVPACWLKPD